LEGDVPASAPFLSREFNGEILLEELEDLRAGNIKQMSLNDCALALREINGRRASEVQLRLKVLAQNHFSNQPALALLLSRWSAKLKVDDDVAALISHVERLALTNSMVAAVMRGHERLQRGLK
jgi:hypothetical protein